MPFFDRAHLPRFYQQISLENITLALTTVGLGILLDRQPNAREIQVAIAIQRLLVRLIANYFDPAQHPNQGAAAAVPNIIGHNPPQQRRG